MQAHTVSLEQMPFYNVPFFLGKTSVVLQCTSPLDPLKDKGQKSDYISTPPASHRTVILPLLIQG